MTTLAELEKNPFPVYARLRREEPVSWVPEARQWLIARWDHAHAVLTDPECFATAHPLTGRCREDTRIRSAFAHGHDADQVRAVAVPVARRAADDVFTAGRADLVVDYFEPVASVTEAVLLGVGVGGADTLRRWGRALARVVNNAGRDPAVDTAAACTLADDAAVAVVVERLRETPDDSVLSRLVAAARRDVLAVLKHVAVSMVEPGWLAAWTLMSLWDDEEQLAEVRAEPVLLEAAVSEALRRSGPVGALGRRTTRPVSLGGAEIPAGSAVAVAVASANRDETVFAEPDRFDVHRDERTHLGFGAGPHACPAHPLVTAVATAALAALFERMPDVRPAPGWHPAPHGWRLRLPGPLDAVWDASVRTAWVRR